MAAPAHRTERLLNLVICLLSTRAWLTKEQIRAAVPQYADCATDEAFDRMFERDKDDLREMGIPLETGSTAPGSTTRWATGSTAAAYALPDVEFTAHELAVLGLASRVWQQASLAGPAARALVKLKAARRRDRRRSRWSASSRGWRTAEPAFEPLYAAIRDRAPGDVRLPLPDGEVVARRLEPWALTSRGGRWYVVGHDRDRGAPGRSGSPGSTGAVRRIGPARSVRRAPTGSTPGEMVDAAPGRPPTRGGPARGSASAAAVVLRRRATAIGRRRPTTAGTSSDLPVVDAGALAAARWRATAPTSSRSSPPTCARPSCACSRALCARATAPRLAG